MLVEMDRVEGPHLDAFAQFYEGLPKDRTRPYCFMFFTSGLLHFVDAAIAFLPRTIRVALIGSALDGQEREWLAQHHPHLPFHHVDMVVDDKTIWEFLFTVAVENFGWIDIDCFILDEELLHETLCLSTNVALSSPFTYQPRTLLRTHFLGVSADAIDALEAAVPTSPCTYTYQPSHVQRFPEHSYSRLLTAEHLNFMERVIPLHGARRYPAEPQQGILDLWSNGLTFQSTDRRFAKEKFVDSGVRQVFPVFDTLVVAQLILIGLGYRLNAVRGGLPEQDRGAFHLGGASYFRRLGADIGDLSREEQRKISALTLPQLCAHYFLARYLVASRQAPDAYAQLLDTLERQLAWSEIAPMAAKVSLRHYLEQHGVSSSDLQHPAWAFIADP